MKKLLYIFAVILLVVSCDKNELGEDVSASSINAINMPVDLQMQAESIVLNILDKIQSGSIATPKATKGNASLARKSNDYVVGHIIATADGAYLTLLDESNDDLCFGDTVATPVYLDNSAGDGSEISVEDADGNVSLVLSGNFSGLFSGANNSIFILNAALDNITAATTFNDDNVATF